MRKAILLLILFISSFVILANFHHAFALRECSPNELEDGSCVPDDYPDVYTGPTSYNITLDRQCYSGGSVIGIGGGGLQNCVSSAAVFGEAYKFSSSPTAIDPSQNQDAAVTICVNSQGIINGPGGLCWTKHKSSGYVWSDENVFTDDGGSIQRGLKYFVMQLTVHDNGQNPNWHGQTLSGYGIKASANISVSGNTINWTSDAADKSVLLQNGNPVAGGGVPPSFSGYTGSYNYNGVPATFILRLSGPDETGSYTTQDFPVDLGGTHLGCVNNACAQMAGAGGNMDGCTAAGQSCGSNQLYRCAGGGGCIACSPSDGCVDGANSWSQAVCEANVGTFCPGGGTGGCSGPGCDTCTGSDCSTGPSCSPPDSKDVGGQCVPSCGAAGGNACNDASACAGLQNLTSWDCSICCSTNPPTGGQRYSCENNSCVADDNGLWPSSSCGGTCGSVAPPTHSACSAGACVSVPGGGSNQCSSRNDCSHSVCTSDGACEMVYSSGADQCSDVGDPDAIDCPQPPPTCSVFTANSDRITPPTTQSTLSWTCRKAHNGCTIDPGNINAGASGAAGHSGSVAVSPPQTTVYTLACSGRGGTAAYETTVHVYKFENGKLKEIGPVSQ